jgi:hypothetical protein
MLELFTKNGERKRLLEYEDRSDSRWETYRGDYCTIKSNAFLGTTLYVNRSGLNISASNEIELCKLPANVVLYESTYISVVVLSSSWAPTTTAVVRAVSDSAGCKLMIRGVANVSNAVVAFTISLPFSNVFIS